MADSTISGLTAATALQAADLAAVVQSGTTKKATLAQIQANSLPLAGGTMTGALVAPASSFTGGNGVTLLMGGDFNSATAVTDATTKNVRIACPHYTNAEERLGIIIGNSSSGSSTVTFGGGSSLVNAVTIGQLNAAANTTTVTGTTMLRWGTAGVRIQSGAAAAASSLFHVAATGNANALRVDDTTGTCAMGRAPVTNVALTLETTQAARPVMLDLRNRQAAAAGVGVTIQARASTATTMGSIQWGWDGAATTDAWMSFYSIGGNALQERGRFTSTGNLLVGTATDVATSLLTLASTTQGFLPPRMTTTQRDAIGTPATGLIVYNTTTNKVNVYTGSAWEAVTSA